MKIHFNNSQTVEITLLENEFIERWKEASSKAEKLGYRKHTWVEDYLRDTPSHSDSQANIINEFNINVDKLYTEHNIAFPGKMHKNQSIKWLNELHRWITYGAFTQQNWALPKATLEEKQHTKKNHWHSYNNTHNPEFIVAGDIADATMILFELNAGIHCYEVYPTYTRKKVLIEKGFIDGRYIEQRYRNTEVVHRVFDHFDHLSIDRKNYCSLKPYDLWLPFAVLGKEYFTSWINEDNPIEFDCTNIDKNWYAGFQFVPSSILSRTLSTDWFQDWLKSYGVPTEVEYIGRIPLGNCTNKHLLNMDAVLTGQVIGVEY